ncbi:hypothetical protein SNEBB_000113 [Seison nebaliae]|nr:hypothetical protein SNEBB_000113 [Seison nebaliae]
MNEPAITSKVNNPITINSFFARKYNMSDGSNTMTDLTSMPNFEMSIPIMDDMIGEREIQGNMMPNYYIGNTSKNPFILDMYDGSMMDEQNMERTENPFLPTSQFLNFSFVTPPSVTVPIHQPPPSIPPRLNFQPSTIDETIGSNESKEFFSKNILWEMSKFPKEENLISLNSTSRMSIEPQDETVIIDEDGTTQDSEMLLNISGDSETKDNLYADVYREPPSFMLKKDLDADLPKFSIISGIIVMKDVCVDNRILSLQEYNDRLDKESGTAKLKEYINSNYAGTKNCKFEYPKMQSNFHSNSKYIDETLTQFNKLWEYLETNEEKFIENFLPESVTSGIRLHKLSPKKQKEIRKQAKKDDLVLYRWIPEARPEYDSVDYDKNLKVEDSWPNVRTGPMMIPKSECWLSRKRKQRTFVQSQIQRQLELVEHVDKPKITKFADYNNESIHETETMNPGLEDGEVEDNGNEENSKEKLTDVNSTKKEKQTQVMVKFERKKPWITPALMAQIIERDKLHNIIKTNHTVELMDRFKKFKNKVNKKVKQAKIHYLNQLAKQEQQITNNL